MSGNASYVIKTIKGFLLNGSHDLVWIGGTCIFDPVYMLSHLFRWIQHIIPFNYQWHSFLIFHFRFPQGSFLTDLVSTKRNLLTSLNLQQFPGALCMIWLILNKRPRLLDFISILIRKYITVPQQVEVKIIVINIAITQRAWSRLWPLKATNIIVLLDSSRMPTGAKGLSLSNVLDGNVLWVRRKEFWPH